ncbi:HAMP domain-containing histidine kinase [Oscillatoria sp. FACHB-1407]|uniref:sensor histidine kinase n=1 Tax=Oscillatoria sp. FACHB-1407 TaxID=2692847 RepID=UPI001686B61B|nr:HAMP domain-containing sensor histidine kinase [Oscillatoria sp. FACHB-1407]MBD2465353.1 HAMP domain-containing histidine kinase [Oscillatoria sp. FACHB-1407]
MLQFQGAFHSKDWHLRTFWLVMGLFVVVFSLELATPPEYVFGYLYIGPILLASAHLSRKITFQATLLACVLTLINIWLPGIATVEVSTIASRFIATLALVVTGVLSDRNRLYQQTVLQQQAKLEAHEKLASIREDFASALTHDLKTPLLGAIETLKAFQHGSFGLVESSQQKVLATMMRSHKTTLQMVETLLDVYRNDNEGLQLNLAPVDLVEVAEEVKATMTDLAASRRVHISLHYGASDFRQFLWVKGDTLQLQRVMANLLTNAINHSPRGGRVEVVLEPGSSYQTVKVTDNGAGIKSDELPHLFERFYQGQSDRQAKGSGLGLYLSRQIVEAHGGTIWAENRHPTGAIFAFRLPTFPYNPSLSA